jgi:hypothetical protein
VYNKIILIDSYEEILNSFGEFYTLMFPMMYYYVAKEKYEFADIMNRAMFVEMKFAFKILNNFPTLKYDAKNLDDRYRNEFLNEWQ